MLHITMIGCGAIGVGVLELLENDPQLCVDYVIASEGSEAWCASAWPVSNNRRRC